MNRGFGFAVGNGVDCSVPTFAELAGAEGDNAPPTAIPAPINAGITVVDRREYLKDFTIRPLFPIVIKIKSRLHFPLIRRYTQYPAPSTNQTSSQDRDEAQPRSQDRV